MAFFIFKRYYSGNNLQHICLAHIKDPLSRRCLPPTMHFGADLWMFSNICQYKCLTYWNLISFLHKDSNFYWWYSSPLDCLIPFSIVLVRKVSEAVLYLLLYFDHLLSIKHLMCLYVWIFVGLAFLPWWSPPSSFQVSYSHCMIPS